MTPALICIQNLSLSFGDKVLFDRLTWTITEKSRIGLVGDNGTGKTTLFRTLLGEIDHYDGTVQLPKNRTIGYLPQDIVSLEPVTMFTYLKKQSGIDRLERDLAAQEAAIAQADPKEAAYPALLRAYEETLARFQSRDGYAFEARARQICRGFGFGPDDFDKDCTTFSGGWKMRILLAALLLARPDILLLDEPTNHLDTESMEWLESYLRDYPGTMIAIAHDRYFLDKLAGQIVELAQGRITAYAGNFSAYLTEKERRLDALRKEMALQRAEIKRTEAFIERFRFKATKARQVQSRIRQLEKFSPVQAAAHEKTVRIQFPAGPQSGREVVTARDLAHRYGRNEVLREVGFTVRRGDRLALVGVNGSGKSTLSRLLAGIEAPAAGEIRYGVHVRMAFFSQDGSANLDPARTVWEEVQAVSSQDDDQRKRNLLGAFLFSGDDIYKPVRVLSGGEKSRLALLKILLTETNLLILDEPTNHLDLKTKEIFQEALLGYAGTLVIVSHDRFFLDRLANRVIELREGRAQEYNGNYSYFIEKRREAEDGAAVPGAAAVNGAPAPKDVRQRSKEERRLEAEERNRLYRARSGLERDLVATEERIARLEEQKTANEALLCLSETHRDARKVRDLSRELQALAAELEDLYARWNDLTEKLAEIR